MKKSSPAWTIQSKHANLKVQKSPSPSLYKPDTWKNQNAPSWKIGHQSRSKAKDQKTPGPGYYETNFSTNSKKLGKFGLQNHRKNILEISPNPQSYSPNFSFTRPTSPLNKFKTSERQQKIQTTPGPANYQKPLNRSVKSCKIGRQERFSDKKQDGPGPGSYHPSRNWFKQISVSFTKSERNVNEKSPIFSPGPTSYNHHSGWLCLNSTKKGYTISGKYKNDKQNVCPGPCDYTPSNQFIFKQTQKISMSPKFKQQIIEKSPGPSDYNNEIVCRKEPKYSIGKERKSRLTVSTSPGPGSYEVVANRKTSPSFSLSGSRLNDTKFSTPGPGSYCPDKNKVKNRPQSATIGNSKKLHQKICSNPGPGEYESIKKTTMCKVSFGKQKKCALKIQYSPGPGAYENPSTIGNFR